MAEAAELRICIFWGDYNVNITTLGSQNKKINKARGKSKIYMKRDQFLVI